MYWIGFVAFVFILSLQDVLINFINITFGFIFSAGMPTEPRLCELARMGTGRKIKSGRFLAVTIRCAVIAAPPDWNYALRTHLD